jgi:hypothetical protein
VLLLGDGLRVESLFEKDRIGDNLRDSFPGTWCDNGDDTETLIVGREGAVSPFFIFLTVLFGYGVVVRLGELGDRDVGRGNVFTGLVVSLNKWLGGFFIIIPGDDFVTMVVFDFLAASEQAHDVMWNFYVFCAM